MVFEMKRLHPDILSNKHYSMFVVVLFLTKKLKHIRKIEIIRKKLILTILIHLMAYVIWEFLERLKHRHPPLKAT